MKNMRLIFFLAFALFFLNSWSNTIDSLKNSLQTQHFTTFDKAKVNHQIANTYFQLNAYDSALVYSNKAVIEFKKLNTDESIIEPLWLYSNILNKLGYNNRLFPVQHQLFQVLIKLQDSTRLMSAYDRMGLYFYHVGIIDSASYYYNKAYEIGKLKNNSKALMDSYNNISQVFNYQGNYEKELEYLNKGLEMAITSNDDYSKGTFYHNIALSYINSMQFNNAMISITKAIEINTVLNETDRLALNKTALGNIYAMQGEVKKAMEYFMEALLYYTKSGNLYGQVESNYNLGFSYYYLEDYLPAQKFFFGALRLSKTISLTSYEIDIYQSLSNVYNKQMDYKKALVYYKRYTNLQDSLTKSTNVLLVSKIQSEYEYERNDIEIRLLSKENELKDRKVQSTIVIATISSISFLVVTILLILIFRKLRRNEDLNTQLIKQNIDIQESHERLKKFEFEIQNDFKYAKHLQHYFYNDTSDFKPIFSDHFFKTYTKKPLSNSFIWTNKIGNKLYWAVITLGHAQLKGAFTGMYVYNMLNKVFFARRFAGVESFSKTFISESFSNAGDQDWGKVQMLFCSLDIKKSEIQFVNIGIDVELIRNAKVWEFNPVCPFITIEKTDSLISNKIQLQANDDIIFYSQNWCRDEEPVSIGNKIYSEVVTSKKPDYNVFLENLIKSEEIDDFVFLSLTK